MSIVSRMDGRVRRSDGRLLFLALPLAWAAISAGSAVAQSVPKYPGVTLRVANCCGVWNKATSAGVDARFEAATDAKLAYTEAYAQQLAPQVIAAGSKIRPTMWSSPTTRPRRSSPRWVSSRSTTPTP